MRTRLAIGVACFALLGPCLSAAEADIAKLAWLGDCWASEKSEPGSGESWAPLAGGTMLGIRLSDIEFPMARLEPRVAGRHGF